MDQSDQPSHPREHLNVLFNSIKHELEQGRGFVPLLGAGISAGSGVPLINELKAYLAQCILRVFGIYEETPVPVRRWDPKEDSWPPVQNLSHGYYNKALLNLDRLVTGWRLDDSTDQHKERSIGLEALGALADWKSSLLFLSRVNLDETCRCVQYLGSPDYDVVDKFFRTVTGGKRASLTHFMIAQLAKPMRCELLLTMNFDELVEEAFEETLEPIDPVAIHLDAQLPAVAHLKEKRTLIKLHGGHYGLRADYSLDQEPTQEDIDTFATYFNVGSSRAMNHAFVIGVSGEERRIVSLLTQTLLKAKTQSRKSGTSRENERIKIYWLCHSVDDQDSVKEAFERHCHSLGSNYDKLRIRVRKCEQLLPNDWSQLKKLSDTEFDVLTVQHPFTGLLLLQLFQELTCNIPPRKSLFPSASQLAVPPAYVAPIQFKDFINKVHGNFNAAAKKAIRAASERFTETASKPRVIRITEGILSTTEETGGTTKTTKTLGHGATSLAAYHFYQEVANFSRTIWLSLENIGSADELFEQLTDAVARAVGIVDWMPIVLHEQHAKAVDEIRRLTEGRGKWIIFIDARDAAGNTRGSSVSDPERPNGWLDDEPLKNDQERDERYPRTSNTKSFFDLIKAITQGRECANVNIVLLYHQYQHNNSAFEETELHKQLEGCQLGKHIEVFNGTPFSEAYRDSNQVWTDEQTTATDPFAHTKAADRGLEWRRIGRKEEMSDLVTRIRKTRLRPAKERPQQIEDERTRRYYFLLGLVCSNRFRYPAMLHDNAFHPPSHLGIEADWKKYSIEPIQLRHDYVFGNHDLFKASDMPLTDGWLSALAKPPHPVVRIAPGGFVWMHADTKQHLRKRMNLSVDLPTKSRRGKPNIRSSKLFQGDDQENLKVHQILRVPLRYACFRAQFGIAQWYDRLFMSSGDPLAGLESAAHFIEAASQGVAIISSDNKARGQYDRWVSRNLKPDFAYDPWLQVTTSLSAALELMPQIKQSALATGYPKASCRMLVWLRAEKLLTLRLAIQQLPNRAASEKVRRAYALDLLDRIILASIESTKTIAREVSEVGRAFHRNRQQFEFYLHRQLIANLDVPEKCKEVLDISEVASEESLCLKRSEQPNLLNPDISSRSDRSRSTTLEHFYALGTLKGKASQASKSAVQKNLASESGIKKYLIEYSKHRRQSAEIALQSRAYGQSIAIILDAIKICFASLENDSSLGFEVLKTDKDPLIKKLKRKAKHVDNKDAVDSIFSCSIDQEAPAILFAINNASQKHSYRLDEVKLLKSPLPKIHKALVKILKDDLNNLIKGFQVELLRTANQEQMEEFRRNLLLLVRWCIVHIESLRYSIEVNEKPNQDNCLAYIDQVGSLAENVYSIFCRASRGGPTREHSPLRNLELQRNMTAQMSTIFAQQRQWKRATECLEAAAELHQPLHPDEGLLGHGVMELHKAQLSMLQIRDWSNPASPERNYQTKPSAIRYRLLDLLKNESPPLRANNIIEKLRIDDLLDDLIYQKIGEEQLQNNIDALDAPRGYLDDAEMALQAAEEVLVKKRKNVWWSTWLFQLQAKAIEYRLLLNLAERSLDVAKEFAADVIANRIGLTNKQKETIQSQKNIWFERLIQSANIGHSAMPTFGQRDSPRHVPTQLDIALDNTMRMVRLDVLRASRLVETYAVCHWGLSVLITLSPDQERLPTRQKSMQVRLGKGIRSLESCLERRQRFTPPLDPYVEAFANNTIDMARDSFRKTIIH